MGTEGGWAMGNGSSAPPRRPVKSGGARARFEPPREMAPAEKGKMQAVAIMTSRRTRAQTLGKLIVRDPSILTNAPVDHDSCVSLPLSCSMSALGAGIYSGVHTSLWKR